MLWEAPQPVQIQGNAWVQPLRPTLNWTCPFAEFCRHVWLSCCFSYIVGPLVPWCSIQHGGQSAAKLHSTVSAPQCPEHLCRDCCVFCQLVHPQVPKKPDCIRIPQWKAACIILIHVIYIYLFWGNSWLSQAWHISGSHLSQSLLQGTGLHLHKVKDWWK